MNTQGVTNKNVPTANFFETDFTVDVELEEHNNCLPNNK